VLQSDVGVYAEPLFRKVHDSLNPGGRFLIVDDRVEDEGIVPDFYVASAFLDSLGDPDFALPSVERIVAMLTQAGFAQVSKGRVSDDYVVIDARR
jgi:hypothetical protein